MPFDRSRYPADWEAISARVRERSGGQCECTGECGRRHQGRCSARHGQTHPDSAYRVIMTAAHLWRGPCAAHDAVGHKCGELAHLAGMCQSCHLSYDRPHHVARRARNRREAKACGDLFTGNYVLTG